MITFKSLFFWDYVGSLSMFEDTFGNFCEKTKAYGVSVTAIVRLGLIFIIRNILIIFLNFLKKKNYKILFTFGNFGQIIYKLKTLIFKLYSVRNVQEFKKNLCYKGNVKFHNIYDVFENRSLKITKIVLNF